MFPLRSLILFFKILTQLFCGMFHFCTESLLLHMDVIEMSSGTTESMSALDGLKFLIIKKETKVSYISPSCSATIK